MDQDIPLFLEDNYHETPQFESDETFDYNVVVYDIEVFVDCMSAVMLRIATGEYKEYCIHLSQPKEVQNENFRRLKQTLKNLNKEETLMIGFNNLGYDAPVLRHLILTDPKTPREWVREAKKKNDEIIATDFADRFKHVQFEDDRLIPQLDLLKLNHFDNRAKSMSLKALEFEMRLENIAETPVDFTKPLPLDKLDDVMKYNLIDVFATGKFASECISEINFRKELKKQHKKYDWLNFSDSKLGSTLMQIEYQKINGWKSIYQTDQKGNLIKKKDKAVKKQTKRDKIHLGSLIFDYVKFKTPQFQAIQDWFNDTTIRETKGALTQLKPKNVPENLIKYMEHKDDQVFQKTDQGVRGIPNLHCILDGLKYVFGTGGIHASVHQKRFDATDEMMIMDWDVSSMYPNLSIVNNIYPEHLGESFCQIYNNLYQERKKHKKGSMKNASIKLALNSVYGNSNNKYSMFYDPQFTMQITVNGQLSLCMLVEMLSHISQFQMIQANTDGITFMVPRSAEEEIIKITKNWEDITKLELESVKYKTMLIHNVNNYIAVEEESGKIKRKGILCARIRRDCDEGKRELGWHQDQSNLVSKLAAEKYMLEGIPVEETLLNHEDLLDFTKRVRVNKSSKLIEGKPGTYNVSWNFDKGELVSDSGNKEHQKISRYYVSHDGVNLTKWMKPRSKNLSLAAKTLLIGVDNPDWTKKKMGELARDPESWPEPFAKMCEHLQECCKKSEEPDYFSLPERYHRVIIDSVASKAAPTIIERGDGESPWNLTVMNNHTNVDKDNIDYGYYVKEAEKLIIN